jgi:hypothetical protein
VNPPDTREGWTGNPGAMPTHKDAERESKRLKAEIDKLTAAGLSEAEKAIADARSAGMAEGTKAGASRLVAAEIKAAAAGRMEPAQLTALLDGINPAAFLNEDGDDVDADKVSRFVNGIAPPAPTDDTPPPTGFPDLGQGSRPTASTPSAGAEFAKFIGRQLS